MLIDQHTLLDLLRELLRMYPNIGEDDQELQSLQKQL